LAASVRHTIAYSSKTCLWTQEGVVAIEIIHRERRHLHVQPNVVRGIRKEAGEVLALRAGDAPRARHVKVARGGAEQKRGPVQS